MKKTYKELRKKLKDEFVCDYINEYPVVGANYDWLRQSGVKSTDIAYSITYMILGKVPHPYQKQDRKIILEFLKQNNYKEFKIAKRSSTTSK